jgi:hypothetical protein
MIEFKKLVKGKIYYQSDPTCDRKYIAQYTGRDNEKYIQIDERTKKTTYEKGGSSDGGNIKTIREATEDEALWLLACIQSKKLVEKPEPQLYSIF